MDETSPAIDSIFLEAIGKPSAQEVAAYLDLACGDDAQLRKRVEKLLKAHEKAARSFLETPATGLPARPISGTDQTMDVSPEALDAGLAATFGPEAAVVVGSAGHSVLKSLSKNLPNVPHVTLHEARGEKTEIVQPGSAQIPNTQDDSRYQLLGEIARGGMGAIIKGRDTDLGRDLAIKVLLDSNQDRPEVIQRFVEEAQIGGQLQHPGIVPVYELGQFPDERPFFTMKLVKGETLAALLAVRKTPADDQPKLLGIFEQMCQTMAYAHTKGVIHRDIKPANIMVGAFGEVQVMDWGLSKVLKSGGVVDEQRSLDKHRDVSVVQTRRSTGSDLPDSVGSQTQMGSVMGTPAYMPPEQALGEIDRLDKRADVFGLGAVLAEILTGKPPYVAKKGIEVYRMASRGKLEDCFSRLDACDAEPELIQLAKTALAPDPDERLRDAGELSDAITQHLEGVQDRLKETEFARVEAETRSEEEKRRKKLYLAIAGLMMILAVGGAFGTALYKQTADQQTQIARQQTKHAQQQTLLAQQEKEHAAVETELKSEALLAQAKAEAEARHATSMRLRFESEIIRDSLPMQSTLLTIEACAVTQRYDGTILPEARDSLLNATIDLNGPPLFGHAKRVSCMAISPDGHWLVTGGKEPRVWDLRSNDRPISSRLLRSHDYESKQYDQTLSVAFMPDSRFVLTWSSGAVRLWDLGADDPSESPRVFAASGPIAISHDGHWMATGGIDEAARLWDMTASDPSASWQTLLGPEGNITQLKFSKDGRRLAACCGNKISPDNAVYIWDLRQDLPAATALELSGHSELVSCLAFDPNNRWLVSGSRDKTARIWDLHADDPSATSQVLESSDAVADVSISADGRWLGLAGDSKDALLSLWSMGNDGPVGSPQVLSGYRRVVFSPTSRWLASSGTNNTPQLWDLAAEGIASSLRVLRGHEDPVYVFSFSPDSNQLVTGSWDSTVRIWDVNATNPSSDRMLRGNQGPIRSVLFSPDMRWIVSACQGDYKIRLWKFNSGSPAVLLPIVLDGYDTNAKFLRGVEISRDSRWLAAVSDNDVHVWDLKADDVANSLRRLMGHTELALCLAFSPDNRWLVSGSKDTTVRVWDLETNAPSVLPFVLEGHAKRTIVNMDVSPDGEWLAAAGGDGILWLWRFPAILAGNEGDPMPSPVHVLNEIGGSVNKLMFSPNNRYVIAGGASGRIARVDLEADDVPASVRVVPGLDLAIFDIWFTPDGRSVLFSGWDNSARMWEIEQMENKQPVRLEGHTKAIFGMSIATGGSRVATTSEDGTARVWDLGADGPSASPMVLQGSGPVAVSPDGRWVLTGNRLWDLDIDAALERARRIVGRQFTPEERKQFSLPPIGDE